MGEALGGERGVNTRTREKLGPTGCRVAPGAGRPAGTWVGIEW